MSDHVVLSCPLVLKHSSKLDGSSFSDTFYSVVNTSQKCPWALMLFGKVTKVTRSSLVEKWSQSITPQNSSSSLLVSLTGNSSGQICFTSADMAGKSNISFLSLTKNIHSHFSFIASLLCDHSTVPCTTHVKNKLSI